MVIKYSDLKDIREINENQKIVLCIGTYDLFHIGHLNFLKHAKELGDILVVLVKGDRYVKIKGTNRPVFDENARVLIVDSIRYVDYTFLVNEDYDIDGYKHVYNISLADEFTWQKYSNIIDSLKPNIYANVDTYNLPKSLSDFYKDKNIEIIIIESTKNISTTKIIEELNK